jgi:hypothetical protein
MRITFLAGTLRTRVAEMRQAESHHQPPRRQNRVRNEQNFRARRSPSVALKHHTALAREAAQRRLPHRVQLAECGAKLGSVEVVAETMPRD